MTAFLAPAVIGGRAYLAPALPPSGSPVAGDPTVPSFTGALAYDATSNSITVNWAGTTSTDDVAVARREYRIGGSGAYTAATSAEEASKSHTFPALSSSTAYQIDVRCVDTSGKVSAPLTISATTNPPGNSGGEQNYIRFKLATHEGVQHVSLGLLNWALFVQLSPAQFGAPVAKGSYSMSAGSAVAKIAVPVAGGWYRFVLCDEDGTTGLNAPILVAP